LTDLKGQLGAALHTEFFKGMAQVVTHGGETNLQQTGNFLV
jgi:UDP:flavonoid glycosyltransferase YjiC (YdhE family)